MEQNDFHLVDVVAFFFVSAVSRKSYLVQHAKARVRGMQEVEEEEKATRFLRER